MAELIDKKAITESRDILDSLELFELTPYISAENLIRFVDNLPSVTEADIRASAIDEFAEKLKWELGQLIFPDSEKFAYPVKEQEQICHQNMTLKRAIRLVDYFSEQLKEE